MPTYEYQCNVCQERFSIREKMADHDPQRAVCPKCRSQNVARVMSGFYARTPRKS